MVNKTVSLFPLRFSVGFREGSGQTLEVPLDHSLRALLFSDPAGLARGCASPTGIILQGLPTFTEELAALGVDGGRTDYSLEKREVPFQDHEGANARLPLSRAQASGVLLATQGHVRRLCLFRCQRLSLNPVR